MPVQIFSVIYLQPSQVLQMINYSLREHCKGALLLIVFIYLMNFRLTVKLLFMIVNHSLLVIIPLKYFMI